MTFSFDITSAPAFVTSLESDLGVLKTGFAAAMTALGSSATAQVTNYYNALVSILVALGALFSIALSAPHGAAAMPVGQALNLVGIKAP